MPMDPEMRLALSRLESQIRDDDAREKNAVSCAVRELWRRQAAQTRELMDATVIMAGRAGK